ncbi:MAG: putative ubiquitin-RnfH superfamily antitoxin RatB of RatAB toxin-antitoxin module [Pseudohongiellaceae bacterium]|jgi:putative ubiquitin-RnfH superfamily antitoxin RatB of RatAB toxin-antitoxin module
MIEVEVAYALPDRQKIYVLMVAQGTTALEAAKRSSVIDDFGVINLDTSKMGVFGQSIRMPDKYELQNGDRVEIYRPLVVDPKEVRRKRAAKAAGKLVD